MVTNGNRLILGFDRDRGSLSGYVVDRRFRSLAKSMGRDPKIELET